MHNVYRPVCARNAWVSVKMYSRLTRRCQLRQLNTVPKCQRSVHHNNLFLRWIIRRPKQRNRQTIAIGSSGLYICSHSAIKTKEKIGWVRVGHKNQFVTFDYIDRAFRPINGWTEKRRNIVHIESTDSRHDTEGRHNRWSLSHCVALLNSVRLLLFVDRRLHANDRFFLGSAPFTNTNITIKRIVTHPCKRTRCIRAHAARKVVYVGCI